MSAATTAVRVPAEMWEDIEDDAEGLLDVWHVAEGDAVQEGEEVASVMLVKTSFEIVSPIAGTVERILVPKGASFGRDDDLAIIASS